MDKITYTIPEAIDKAQNIVANPEVMLSQAQTVALVSALLAAIKSSSCFYKAMMEGHRTFVLLDCDPAAPYAVAAWAAEAEAVGHRMDKVEDARRVAADFAKAPKKKPDGPPRRTALNPAAAWPFPERNVPGRNV